MSKDKSDAPEPKKGKSMMMVILLVSIIMLVIGGGGAFMLVRMGVIGGPKAKADNRPKLVLKSDEDPYAPKSETKDAAPSPEGDGGSPYKTSYYVFADEFTSNLKGSSSLIQVSLACSTHRDGRVIAWVKQNELAIRSAILEVLADTPTDDLDTIEGKQRLQKRLTSAINQVLVQTEGFGGIDEVYFKSFLVQ